MKKRTSVYIDEELLEYAKRNKINLSQLLEEAIREVKNQNKQGRTRASRARCPGSNPGGRTAYLFLRR